jgi:hypothetical protein
LVLALRGQSRDLRLLRRELTEVSTVRLRARSPVGEQLDPRPLSEGVHPEVGESLVREAQLHARVKRRRSRRSHSPYRR